MTKNESFGRNENLSPFRYPGGKYNYTNYVASFLEANLLVGSTFVEPFAGSAAIGLNLLKRGFIGRLDICEIDPLMSAFWKVMCSRSSAKVIRRVQECEISLETWKECRTIFVEPSEYNQVDRAFSALFLNRTSYSGMIGAGPIGGMRQASEYTIDCRFNRHTVVNKLKEIAKLSGKIRVFSSCGIDQIRAYKKSDNAVFYIDPPYFKMGPRLYRSYFSYEDHHRLCSAVCKTPAPWLISYDRHPDILDLYRDQRIASLDVLYSAKVRSPNKEILIASKNVRFPGEVENKRLLLKYDFSSPRGVADLPMVQSLAAD